MRWIKKWLGLPVASSPRLPRRRARGFTIVEMVVSATMSSVLMVAIVSLQYISARAIKEIYGQARMRAARVQALDQIRYRLCEARMDDGTGVNVKISQDAHRIEFRDPNLGGVFSVFYYVPTEYALYYDDNESDNNPATVVAKGPTDITFQKAMQLDGTGPMIDMIQINVKTEAVLAYGNVDKQDWATTVYLSQPVL